MKKFVIILLLCPLGFLNLNSQCAQPQNCTITLEGTTDYTADDPATVVCIVNSYSGNLSISNGATVVVSAGATWTVNSTLVYNGSSLFNDGTINVTGTLVVGPSSVLINSSSGAISITEELIFNSNWPNEGDQPCPIDNAGIMTADYVENVNTYVTNSGTLNVIREMYNHGDFTNSGSVNITCPPGTTNCSFTVGDFVLDHNYSNAGGTTSINGAAYFDGNIDGSGLYECLNLNETVRFSADGYTGSDVFAVNGVFDIQSAMGSNDGDATNDPTMEVLGQITTPSNCIGGDIVVNICPAYAPLSNTDICGNYIQQDVVCGNNLLSLPVTLKNFRYTVKNDYLIFDWETEREVNFSHFELEKSEDAQTFSIIQELSSTNKSQGDRYTSSSFSSKQAEGYYRLKLVDLNGKTSYSNILHYDGPEGSAQVFPNPLGENDALTIEVSTKKEIQITLYDLTGQQISQYNRVGEYSYQIDMFENLEHGTYYLRIDGTDFKSTQKIIY